MCLSARTRGRKIILKKKKMERSRRRMEHAVMAGILERGGKGGGEGEEADGEVMARAEGRGREENQRQELERKLIVA